MIGGVPMTGNVQDTRDVEDGRCAEDAGDVGGGRVSGADVSGLLTPVCDALAAGSAIVLPGPPPLTYVVAATTPAAVNTAKGRPAGQEVAAWITGDVTWASLSGMLALDAAGVALARRLLVDEQVTLLVPLRADVPAADWLAPAVRDGYALLFGARWGPLRVLHERFPLLYVSSANRTGHAPAAHAAAARAMLGPHIPVLDADALPPQAGAGADAGPRRAATTMLRLRHRLPTQTTSAGETSAGGAAAGGGVSGGVVIGGWAVDLVRRGAQDAAHPDPAAYLAELRRRHAPGVVVPSGRGTLRTVEWSEVDAAMLDILYTDILVPSFPPQELVTPGELRAAAAGEGLGTLVFDGPTLVGAMLGGMYSRSRVLLLGYLATRPAARGNGIGRMLLTEVLPRWRARSHPSLIVAEIEDPRFHHATSYGDPVARLRLYARIGARLMPMPYFQPALRPGLHRVADMLLICLDEAASEVPASVVGTFLDEYFSECEGPGVIATEPDYQALRGSLRAQGEPDRGGDTAIPLWPLDRFPDVPRFAATATAVPVTRAVPAVPGGPAGRPGEQTG